MSARSFRPKLLFSTAGAPSTPSHVNPFPGPRPYGSDDFFRGRGEAVEELISVVLSSTIVLLNAPSGNGKSSLIEAGLRPRLTDVGVTSLPTVRLAVDDVGPQARSGPAVTSQRPPANPFVAAVANALLDPTTVNIDEEIHLRDVIRAARETYGSGTLLLILDQFEEIFLNPRLWRETAEFFDELRRAVKADNLLRVIIGIRADYLANFIAHEDALPRRMVERFPLLSLNEQDSREVVELTFASTGSEISNADLDRLMRSLFTLPSTGDGEPSIRAEFVDLIQLQIICRRVWDRRAGHEVRPSDVEDFSDEDVRQSMSSFVDATVKAVVTSTKFDEDFLRAWLGRELIIKGKYRGTAPASVHEAAVPLDVIGQLADRGLIRVEQRNRTRWAELSHDRMVDAVRDSNEARDSVRRVSRRKWKLGAWVAAVATILGGFLLIPPSGHHLVSKAPGRYSGPSLATFSPRHGTDVSVLTIGAGSSGTSPSASGSQATVTISIDELGPHGGFAGVRAFGVYDSSASEFFLATPTIPGRRYRVAVSPSYSQLAVSYLNIDDTNVDNIDFTSSASTDIDIPARGIALQLPPDNLIDFKFADETGLVQAQSIITARDTDTFLSTGGEHEYVFVSDHGRRSHVTVQKVDSHSDLAVGAQESRKIGQSTLLRVVLSANALPVTVTAQCAGGADTRLVDGAGNDVGDSNDYYGATGGKFTSLVSRLPGNGMFLDVEPYSGTASCAVGVKSSGVAPVDRGGSDSMTLPPQDTAAVARAIHLDQDAVLTVPAISGVTMSLNCAQGGAAASGAFGARLAAFVPADTTCVVLAERDTDSKSVTQIPFIIIPVPTNGKR